MKVLAFQTTEDFVRLFRGEPLIYSQAPGRINIIGEHTDYTGGLSLPAAINCWTLCAWRPRQDNKIRIYAANMDEFWETSWREISGAMNSSWKKYVGGALLVFKENALNGAAAFGLELTIRGNVPLGKGVSSSASIELAVLNGLNTLYKTKVAPVTLAKLAQQVEHRYLNLKSGLLDQFASQFGKKDHALLIDFARLETQLVPLASAFESYSWVLVDSMVKRELAGSKYSARVEECAQIKTILERQEKSLRQISSADIEPLFGGASDNILRRARHIVSENERTLHAFECLRSGEVKELGRLLLAAHHSLAADYEVSHPNLDFIVNAATTMSGVVGGRMMGGGFGGCCLLLVEKRCRESFAAHIAEEYQRFCSLKTEPYNCEFVGGASAWTYGN